MCYRWELMYGVNEGQVDTIIIIDCSINRKMWNEKRDLYDVTKKAPTYEHFCARSSQNLASRSFCLEEVCTTPLYLKHYFIYNHLELTWKLTRHGSSELSKLIKWMIVPQMFKLTLSSFAVTQLAHQSHFYHHTEYTLYTAICLRRFRTT